MVVAYDSTSFAPQEVDTIHDFKIQFSNLLANLNPEYYLSKILLYQESQIEQVQDDDMFYVSLIEVQDDDDDLEDNALHSIDVEVVKVNDVYSKINDSIKSLTNDVRALNKDYHRAFEKRENALKKQLDEAMSKIKELEPLSIIHDTQDTYT
ncbi:hypothetical protein L2E82_31458 [Cichorium intybus]|uniref:Uncharacterized protein n=1 Tax=Cichorium intybus TaxID=13427 RepID=A0ACB9D3D4_CICIN|nr:hypothetical protein L2E82_31458 [Cichorium intybus]